MRPSSTFLPVLHLQFSPFLSSLYVYDWSECLASNRQFIYNTIVFPDCPHLLFLHRWLLQLAYQGDFNQLQLARPLTDSLTIDHRVGSIFGYRISLLIPVFRFSFFDNLLLFNSLREAGSSPSLFDAKFNLLLLAARRGRVQLSKHRSKQSLNILTN